ncbi:TIGR03435 family protein [Terriglobus tenax]|uniref:TIGR03435 family protein n=1 Tax=Terriglobus tenax TaxID=1111115 RepID=UPI0021E0411A|nr:TIGR03435 family protein [Terriglobus tenax]
MKKRLLFGLGVFGVLSAAAWGQQSAAAKPAFTLADVHDSPRMMVPISNGGQLYGDRYILHQSSIVDIIAKAYDVKPEMVQGGPSWLEMKRYEIVAKADPKTSDADLRLMLQSLLADRFKLVLHKGEAPMPAFLLTAPGGKTKMKPSEEGQQRDCRPEPNQTAGGAPLIAIACKGFTPEELATFLNQAANSYLTEPVLNQTGLEGKYDFSIRWTDMRVRAKAGAEAVSIFDAVDKDLGLKLELKTAPRSVWIVDSVSEKPSPNSPAVARELPPRPPAQFDVASIKPSQPGENPMAMVRNGQMNISSMPLRFLIVFAWDLNPNDPNLIVNAPKWLEESKFNMVAKAALPESLPGRPPAQIDNDEFRQMLRNLLMERFQMKVHMEDRPIDAYKMVADHPKLKAADPKSRTRCKEGPGPDGKDPRQANPMITALWSCQNISMKQLGEELAHYATGYVYTPVLDGTGLSGGYDLTLAWSSASLTILKPPPAPGEQNSAQQGATDPNGAITLYEAMDKQLGIKMVKEKRPVPVLVIDHIEETPTAN